MRTSTGDPTILHTVALITTREGTARTSFPSAWRHRGGATPEISHGRTRTDHGSTSNGLRTPLHHGSMSGNSDPLPWPTNGPGSLHTITTCGMETLFSTDMELLGIIPQSSREEVESSHSSPTTARTHITNHSSLLRKAWIQQVKRSTGVGQYGRFT